MNVKNSIQSAFKKFKDFKGKSNRKEFWYFFIYFFILSNILLIPASSMLIYQTIQDLYAIKENRPYEPITQTSPLAIVLFAAGMIFTLIHLIPLLALTIRRLHDIPKSGKWILLILIPFIGPLVLLFILSKKGNSPISNNIENLRSNLS